LLAPETPFNFELSERETVNAGDAVTIMYKGNVILRGMIDSVTVRYDSTGIFQNVSGRTWISVLVDNYLENFSSVSGQTFQQIITAIVSKYSLFMENCSVLFLGKSDKYTALEDYAKPEPGDTAFDFIKKLCESRGVTFYMDRNGTLVFNDTKTIAEPSYNFSVVARGTNYEQTFPVISGAYVKDSTQWYDKVVVIGQAQDEKAIKYNYKTVVNDNTAPVKKTIVLNQNGNVKPKTFANRYIEQQRMQSNSIEYVVAGHDFKGVLYEYNKICNISDSVLGVNGVYLIAVCEYRFDLMSGIQTSLKISNRGV
jgi:prophage tail gpP-like protein